MRQRDPRLMTPREIVSELASILASGCLPRVTARRFMDEGGPLPSGCGDAPGAGRGETPDPRENGAPGGRWGPVYGELLTFDDPETRLPAIDHLEGFLPCLRRGRDRQAGGPSLSRRVLAPTRTRRRRVPVWLYVEGAGTRRPARRPADGLWRPWGRRLPELF